jgi:hypothetical protein
MGFFTRKPKPIAEDEPLLAVAPKQDVQTIELKPTPAAEMAKPRSKARQTRPYRVRVRQGFEREILLLQGQIQTERQQGGGKARKVTQGEVVELMLESFLVARRNRECAGYAVPIPDDVWYGLDQIAHRLQMSKADAFEQLIIEKLTELGLIPRQ